MRCPALDILDLDFDPHTSSMSGVRVPQRVSLIVTEYILAYIHSLGFLFDKPTTMCRLPGPSGIAQAVLQPARMRPASICHAPLTACPGPSGAPPCNLIPPHRISSPFILQHQLPSHVGRANDATKPLPPFSAGTEKLIFGKPFPRRLPFVHPLRDVLRLGVGRHG